MNTAIATMSVNTIFLIILAILLILKLIDHQIMARSFKQKFHSLSLHHDLWWITTCILWFIYHTNHIVTTLIFFLLSFMILREFMTLVYQRRDDHYTIACAFYIVLPLQYYLVLIKQYNILSIFIPIYLFFILPLISSITHNQHHLFERTAKIQWGIMVTIFGLSHLPAILSLNHSDQSNILLVLFMLIVLEIGNISQKLLHSIQNTHHLMPYITSIIFSTLTAALFYWLTPFSTFQAAIIGLSLYLIGSIGHHILEMMKKEMNVTGWGRVSQGQHGILDRVDKICFAAPLLFHILYYFSP